MKLVPAWLRLGPILLLAAVLASPAPVLGNQDENNRERDNDREKVERRPEVKREAWKLKTFELEHRSPEEVARLLALQRHRILTEHPVLHRARPGMAARHRMMMFRFAPGPRIAFDPDRKLLFVRGTEEQIKKVEEMIEKFDVAAKDLERQEIGDMKLLPVQRDKAPQVSRILFQLRIPHRPVRMDDVTFIAVPKDDRDNGFVQQAEEVISKMKEVEVKDNDTAEEETEENDN